MVYNDYVVISKKAINLSKKKTQDVLIMWPLYNTLNIKVNVLLRLGSLIKFAGFVLNSYFWNSIGLHIAG